MQVTKKVFINRNADVVFRYLASPENEPLWRASTLRTASDPPGLLHAGSSGMSLIRFMGREIETRWRIAEFEQDARLCKEYDPGVRGGRDRYSLTPFGIGATILEVKVEVEVSGLMGLLANSRRTSMEHELRTDLQHLKRIIEASN